LLTRKALAKSEGDMEIGENDHVAMLKNICGFYEIPKHINGVKLVECHSVFIGTKCHPP
jgi:hypothetical protein